MARYSRPVRRKRHHLLLLAAGLACLVLSGNASAAPAWLPPVQLAGPGGEATPDVAMDPAGDAVAVWSAPGDAGYDVRTSTHRPGPTGWTAPDLLATSEGAAFPHVVLDAAGDALVVWTQWHDGVPTLTSSQRRAGETAWGPAQTIADSPGAAPTASLAVDSAGDAVVAWVEYSDADTILRVSYRPASSGTWQAPVTVPAGLVQTAAVAIGADGQAVLAWSKFTSSESGIRYVVSAASGSGGTWSAPVDLVSSPGFVAGPDVTVDGHGAATAAWSELDGGNDVVWAASRPVAGTWQAPVRLSFADGNASDPDVGSDANGDVLAVWSTPSDAESSFRPAGGDWTRPVVVPGSGPEAQPRLAVNARGDAVAAWPDYIAGVLLGSARPAGGAWQPAAAVGPFASNGPLSPRVAIGGSGDGVAVWNRIGTDVGEDTLLAAAYDVAGPKLELTAPTGGTAGTSLDFSIVATDVWSPLAGAPTWSFGDGQTASGTSVQHAFAAAGTYTVTVTQADALGNESHATATVTVSAHVVRAAVVKRPTVRGVARVGRTLTCAKGTWRGTAPVRFAYAWLRDGRARARGSRLKLKAADAKHLVSCTVTATNAAGSVRARSRSVRVRVR